MKELRANYQGRSGRYTVADTSNMDLLKVNHSRAWRFLPPGVANPDIVSGKKVTNAAKSIAQNADHCAIPLVLYYPVEKWRPPASRSAMRAGPAWKRVP